MARISFKSEYRPQIESGEYKVVTDCGEPVEIVKWNCKGECPILAVIDDGDVEDTCFFNEAGISPHGTDSLYVITDEPKLTEFQRLLGECVMEAQCSVVDPLVHSVKWSDALLEEALKDMPKWKLNLSDTSNLPDAYSIVHEFEAGKDYSCITRMLECGNYRIKIEDLLNKLPKEG